MPQPALPARVTGTLFAKLIAFSAAALLAGCASGTSDPADMIGNLAARGAFGGSPPVAQQAAATETNVICPSTEIKEGGSNYRVYAGAQSSENVRYQYSFGDIARECRVVNGQILIKVGVEGKVLLGPAGQPSSFNVPVFIGVRSEAAGEQMLVSKVYSAAVTIPAGQTQGSFAIISDELAVPFTQENANDDYTVFIGFEGPGKAPAQRTARARRQRH